jgi:hypothetical protein
MVLEEWGRDYGGGKYENIGYSSISTIATLIEHHGFRPDSQIAKTCTRLDSISDLIESIVMRLQRQGVDGEAEAHCLRVAYDPITYKERLRLARLRAIGNRIKNPIMRQIRRREYYRRLASAREYIVNEHRAIKAA